MSDASSRLSPKSDRYACSPRQQHVGGLDVAVDEPGRVRRVEPGGDLGDDRRRDVRRQALLALEQRVQVGPAHPAHDQVEVPVRLAGLVDRHDVGVVDRRREARLALEALAEVAVGGVVRGDQLERHRAPEIQLRGPVDDAHAAATGDRIDAAAGELFAWEELGHALPL